MGTMREAEPMPPFKLWQTVPAPAPTQPCAKSSDALSMAANTCSARTARCWMSLSPASLHSQTMGLTERTDTPCALP